jgi:hypothetical protein
MGIPLDPVGNTSLALQVIILFLLVLGLPLSKEKITPKSLLRHGYFTVAALVLHTILIFVVMVPSLGDGLGSLGSLSLWEALIVWSHVVLGAMAEIIGIIIIVPWVRSPRKMGCARRKPWMTPLFIIWVVSVINGALLHILGILS